MSHLSDNELDRLSREAAEQYDVEQSPSGWERLESQLDKTLPVARKFVWRRFYLPLSSVVLLSGAFLTWILTRPTAPSVKADKPLTTLAPHTTEQNKGPAVIPGAPGTGTPAIVPGKNEAGQAVPGTAGSNPPAINENNQTKSNDIAKNIPTNTNTYTIPSTGMPPAASPASGKNTSAAGNDISGKSTSAGRPGKKTVPVSGKPSKTAAAVDHADQPVSDTRQTVSPGRLPANEPAKDNSAGRDQVNGTLRNEGRQDLAQPQHQAPADHSTAGNPASTERVIRELMPSAINGLPAAGDQLSGLPQARRAPSLRVSPAAVDSAWLAANKKSAPVIFNEGWAPWQIGFVFAPDFSNVRFSGNSKTGYNVGVQISHRLNRHWSLNTGLLYTLKNYTARAEDFSKKPPFPNYVVLEKAEGTCSMFDIPLNIRYDFSSNLKSRFFVSTGLSTYLMTAEAYDYNLRVIGTYERKHYEYDDGQTYLLSIWNLSAGFERKLDNTLSLQVEPYLKIPLSGIGYGGLQLNSYGVYFSLKFSIPKK